jgi:hypothetical protein
MKAHGVPHGDSTVWIACDVSTDLAEAIVLSHCALEFRRCRLDPKAQLFLDLLASAAVL